MHATKKESKRNVECIRCTSSVKPDVQCRSLAKTEPFEITWIFTIAISNWTSNMIEMNIFGHYTKQTLEMTRTETQPIKTHPFTTLGLNINDILNSPLKFKAFISYILCWTFNFDPAAWKDYNRVCQMFITIYNIIGETFNAHLSVNLPIMQQSQQGYRTRTLLNFNYFN